MTTKNRNNPNTTRTTRSATLAAATLIALCGQAGAQVLNVQATSTATVFGQANADEFLITPQGVADVKNCTANLAPGVGGADFGAQCADTAIEELPGTPSIVTSTYSSGVLVNGDGTAGICVDFVNQVENDATTLEGYSANARAHASASIDLLIAGLPAGTPVIVEWTFTATGAETTFHETANFEDAAATTSNAVTINGTPLVGGALDFSSPPLPGSASSGIGPTAGSFPAIAGDVINVGLNSSSAATIELQGQLLGGLLTDQSSAEFSGQLCVRVREDDNTGDPDVLADFSLDIGSQHELSALDPSTEWFDPGDTYPWFGPALPPCGADGIQDDTLIFLTDWLPDVPDCTGGTAAPLCSFIPPSDGILVEWFDLDGHDNTDFSILQLGGPTGFFGPVPQFPSACVFPPTHLGLSCDDDQAAHYVGDPATGACEIPISSPSPFLGLTYGTTAGNDEVFAIEVSPIPGMPLVSFYTVVDEVTLHTSLAPNPDNSEEQDDDVDSLDIRRADTCPNWYFSPDHEATALGSGGAPLDPGAIYEVLPGGGAVPVILPGIHLGLPDGVDVDAFEFAWIGTSDDARFLALLFSVDDNDPTTPLDESGGLDPKMIYFSLLDGTSGPYLQQPMRDDIDAITNWPDRIDSIVPTPPCPGDADGNGVVDVNDITVVINNLGNVGAPGIPGDVDNNGVVDVNDITLVVNNLGTVCP